MKGIKGESVFWWCSATFRISQIGIEWAQALSNFSLPDIDADTSGTFEWRCEQKDGKLHYQGEYRVRSPQKPDCVIAWAEAFASKNRSELEQLLLAGCKVYIYVGVHSQVLALGFDLPRTPTLSALEIPIGIEYFSG